MLTAALYAMSAPRQVVLAGREEDLGPFLEVLRTRFLPNHTVLLSSAQDTNAALRDMTSLDGRPTAYVCENFACQLPTTEVGKFAELLQ
jgi:uncharacterized protein YyaL (SSP411 family)